MSQTQILTDPTTESTPRPSVKDVAIALAKPLSLVAFGVVCGIVVEKMKNKGSDTTESA